MRHCVIGVGRCVCVCVCVCVCLHAIKEMKNASSLQQTLNRDQPTCNRRSPFARSLPMLAFTGQSSESAPRSGAVEARAAGLRPSVHHTETKAGPW